MCTYLTCQRARRPSAPVSKAALYGSLGKWGVHSVYRFTGHTERGASDYEYSKGIVWRDSGEIYVVQYEYMYFRDIPTKVRTFFAIASFQYLKTFSGTYGIKWAFYSHILFAGSLTLGAAC
jgi:hypothetical protein